MSKRTVVFDFDGVIHSYKSGWKGPANIPDPPVPGIREAMKSIMDAGFAVIIVSSRLAYPEGQEAMRKWLEHHQIPYDQLMREKPPAICYIDDRAICFDGHPEKLLGRIKAFQPWYRKEVD